VNWIRLGAVTHNFDQSQRINRLAFTAGPGVLTVTAPATPIQCQPGHYMPFILNSNGVPSVSKIVRIGMGVSAIARVGNDNQVTGTTVAGSRYQLERNDALTSTNNVWIVVGTAATASSFTTTFTDTGGASAPKRFYRIRQVP
jgi:hypothetical protein